ncbi:hypothetical protein CVT24_008633 [Panaeolus cyanescens]|uniref:1-phosphatidylinositol-3-phosphate 5-kinase n=1 Tax=Panaeolus cyanescens TaxID=181874 RepID=A0A409WED4_9AGAR|nr:hypothetical protein CVT24_008633 [Panaeolus cyanescens]
MDPPGTPPTIDPAIAQSNRSTATSSTKLADDVTSLTSFNPFSEEDEHDQSSYTIVRSIFSRMKNTLSAPLSAKATPTTNAALGTTVNNVQSPPQNMSLETKRPSFPQLQNASSGISTRVHSSDRRNPLMAGPGQAAPPLVSLTPAQSELPTYNNPDYDKANHNRTPYSPAFDATDPMGFGTSIPGFPIQDDARSIKTSTSIHRSGSVSKVMRRLRGEGLSRDYWMDDENCKECYDCKSVFTTWRRKHHCRICGQIFCSRCASNIIKGARFGAEGMVRVCNLCLEKPAKMEDDDDDDRRSVVSSITSFPAHQLGGDAFHNGHPASPFATSHLFGRMDEPFNLSSIAESRRNTHSNSEHSIHLREGEDGVWESVRDNPAPFRRGLSQDDRDPTTMTGSFHSSPKESHIKSQIKFPSSIPLPIDTSTSSIQFPLASPEHLGTPRTMSKLGSGPHGEFEVATPFIRSRVQSRLDSPLEIEPGWRTRRESTAYAQELNLTSMMHLKIMLRQMLTLEEIPNVKEWEETLLRLSLRIAREMTFTSLPNRQGQDMDVRRYVKIKKIPGGTPRDSEYVDGAVITKNVAHKKMSRLQQNPRVMLITFPLEFSRVEGQYLHFGQIVRQEKEYLGNLASRIAALRPHVVLVEKSVSRLALDALAQYNIAVARSVKSSAIRTIARMTQGDVFSSMDKLASEPHLGHCARYVIKTYDHPLIPGRRKTYMRFEGCNRDMGCTIVLRGGDIETLRRIKKVTRFLTFIVRNLKLETHLWKNYLVTLPPFNSMAIPQSNKQLMVTANPTTSLLLTSSNILASKSILPDQLERTFNDTDVEDLKEDEHLPFEDAEQLRLTRRIDESLEPYTKRFISVSATLRFAPPYPIRRMKELDNLLLEAKKAWEDEIVSKEEPIQPMHAQEATITPSTTSDGLGQVVTESGSEDRDDLVSQIEALPLHTEPTTPVIADGLPSTGTTSSEEGTSYFNLAMTTTSALSTHGSGSSSTTFGYPLNDLVEEVLKTEQDIALQSNYTWIKWQHDEFRRIWEWYLRKNPDDFVVEKYQCIHLREYTIPNTDHLDHKPCSTPRSSCIKFYGENDVTLGQYIDKTITDTWVQYLDPRAICTRKGCDQPLHLHRKVFVHNETRISVTVEPQATNTNDFSTWSVCRVCNSITPVLDVSPEMQRYSFAKFLELHFYPADVKLLTHPSCSHNIYHLHRRYFTLKHMTVRFETNPVTVNEVVYPPFRIRVRPQTQLAIKNADFKRLQDRNNYWYSSLIDDLRLIIIDAATGDEEADAVLLADINRLITRAEAEREEILRLMNQVYRDSSPTDTLALNQVHAYRQDKIVAWQNDFDRLPKPRSGQTIYGRSGKRSSGVVSVRDMWRSDRYNSTGINYSQIFSAPLSEAEEGPEKRAATPEPSASASDASESDANVQEKKATLQPTQVDEEASQLSTSAEPPSTTDAESDATIGVSKDMSKDNNPVDPASIALPESPIHTRMGQQTSRLPRPAGHNLSVAELVQRYSNVLPAQGIPDLAQSALGPRQLVSESEQDSEYPSHMTIRPTVRNKTRHRPPLRSKISTSDFEQGYAANVAPKYPSYMRRNLGSHNNARAPGHKGSLDSQVSSRRTSPEKRSLTLPANDPHENGPSSPRPSNLRHGKGRIVSRSKEKATTKPPNSAGTRTGFKRQLPTTMGKVSTMAKHWDKMAKDREANNKTRYAVIRGRRARPVVSGRAEIQVLTSVKDAIHDEPESANESSSEADDEDEGNDEDQIPVPKPEQKSQPLEQATLPENEAQPSKEIHSMDVTEVKEDEAPSEATEPNMPAAEPTQSPGSPAPSTSTRETQDILLSPPLLDEMTGIATERHSILKALSGFWPPSRRNIEGDDPASDSEHIFRDSSMVVRLDEPTSIIALALNSPQYRDMLAKSRAEKRTTREVKFSEGGEIFMPDDRSTADTASTWGVVNLDSVDSVDPTEDLRAPSSKLPWAITFESSGLIISCTILYPEQFDALRRTYDCEKSMVESLSRCVKWNASGGKSGSAFLKTQDDRFIAKELSKPELETMETFAPAYFDYMSSSVNANRPTLLAKVFGCYKLTFRRTGTGKDRVQGKTKSTQMNLLVMENLFYDRQFAKIYDLKGSTRNRHVQATGRLNEVLLDENLVETAHLDPFYVREHSKRILRGALYNDSKFLADINVMDYSLVCGVDKEKNELVVGIVDYIRTYTWDKKLETWVKESAFLGGAAKGEPTIVTPKQYRQRFLGAMERYFPLLPDRWMKQQDAIEEEAMASSELWPDW